MCLSAAVSVDVFADAQGDASPRAQNEAFAADVLRRLPVGRIGEIDEVTGAVVYLASPASSLVTGHVLHVESRKQNIKVTAVIAGGMRRPFILDRFPDTDPGVLQDPKNVAETVRFVLTQPEESVIPEVMVLPMRETSWP